MREHILLLVCTEPGDFFDMKGVVEEFFEKSGMKKKVHYTPDSNKTYLHPGRQANISYEAK